MSLKYVGLAKVTVIAAHPGGGEILYQSPRAVGASGSEVESRTPEVSAPEVESRREVESPL